MSCVLKEEWEPEVRSCGALTDCLCLFPLPYWPYIFIQTLQDCGVLWVLSIIWALDYGINYFNHFFAKFFNCISHFSFTSLIWQILRWLSKIVHVPLDSTRHSTDIGKQPPTETQLRMLPFQLWNHFFILLIT